MPFLDDQNVSSLDWRYGLNFIGGAGKGSSPEGKVKRLKSFDVVYLFDDTILPKVYRIISGIYTGKNIFISFPPWWDRAEF